MNVRLCLLAFILAIFALGSSAGVTAATRPSIPPLPECLAGKLNRPCYSPPQIRNAYNVNPLLKHGSSGQGRTIAIIASFGSPTIRADLHAFDAAFKLPDPQLDIYSPLGTPKGTHQGWAGETSLDVEWAHAVAPGARIMLLTSPVDETEGTQGIPEFLSLERYAVAHGADVVSQSWGATEETLMDSAGRQLLHQFDSFYASATKRGVTFVAGSGDDGAGGLDTSLKHFFPYRVVGWPASDPYVLGVGGTVLDGSKGGADETAWTGSGGGVSKIYSEPAFQRALPASVQGFLKGKRGVPDVAYNAGSPVLIILHGRWTLAGGTSAGTPQWAGLVALLDQDAGHDIGLLNPALYRLAGSSRYHADLNDIRTGSIKDPPGNTSSGPPLSAARGWDPVTGLGTPRAAELVPDLAAAKGT